MAWLDRGSATWNRWVDTGDHLGLPAFATSLRPAWWVLRALCAAALVAELFSSQGVYGFTVERAIVAVVAVWVSVQIGRGRWWPGTMVRRSMTVRVALIGLNVLAVALLPVMFGRFMAPMDRDLYYGEPSYSQPAGDGLSFNGEPVANIYPYDAQGHGLTGVQLVDRQGRRLNLNQDPYGEESGWGEFVHAPWLNGRTELYSVFPLPEQTLDPDTTEPVGEPRLQAPPFASLPPVTFPGIRPSVVAPAQTPAEQAAALRKAAQERQQALRDELRQKRQGDNGD